MFLLNLNNFSKINFISILIVTTALCDNNTVVLSQIQITGEVGQVAGGNPTGRVKIEILGKDNDLKIDTQTQTVSGGTKETGTADINQGRYISSNIQNLPTNMLNELASTSVVYVSVIKPTASSGGATNAIPQYLSSGILYNGEQLGLNADDLVNKHDDANNTIFGWLGSMAQSGSGWNQAGTAGVAQDISGCTPKVVCFASDDFKAVQDILSGAYTADSVQQKLYNLVAQAGSNTEDNLIQVFSVLNRLIALWVYRQAPNKDNFTVVSCKQNVDFLESILTKLVNAARDYQDSTNTLNQTVTDFINCMKNSDKLTPAGNSVQDYLIESASMTSQPQCATQFNAWVQATSNQATNLLNYFNIVDSYPAASGTSSINSPSGAAEISTNSAYQASCSGAGGTGEVVFGSDAKAGTFKIYTPTNAGLFEYNYAGISSSFKVASLLNPATKQPYLAYASQYNGKSLFNFFFQQGKPILENGTPKQYFHLAPNGKVYDVCPTGQTCANIRMCPTEFTAGSGITSCEMLTTCPADDGTGNAPTCLSIFLQVPAVTNSFCLVTQDIKNRIKLAKGLCFGQISTDAFHSLENQQIAATNASKRSQEQQQTMGFQFGYGMVVMPIAFGVMSKLTEKVWNLGEEAWKNRESAIKAEYGQNMTKSLYEKLKSGGLQDNYKTLRQLDENRNKKTPEKKLTPEQLAEAAGNMKFHGLNAAEALVLENLPTDVKAKALDGVAKGQSFGEALKLAEGIKAPSSGSIDASLSDISGNIGDITPDMAQNWQEGQKFNTAAGEFTFKGVEDGVYKFEGSNGEIEKYKFENDKLELQKDLETGGGTPGESIPGVE